MYCLYIQTSPVCWLNVTCQPGREAGRHLHAVIAPVARDESLVRKPSPDDVQVLDIASGDAETIARIGVTVSANHQVPRAGSEAGCDFAIECQPNSHTRYWSRSLSDRESGPERRRYYEEPMVQNCNARTDRDYRCWFPVTRERAQDCSLE